MTMRHLKLTVHDMPHIAAVAVILRETQKLHLVNHNNYRYYRRESHMLYSIGRCIVPLGFGSHP